MGPNSEPLPTSELAILLSIFHLSLRQAERAKLQVLLIIECSILICTKGNSSGFLEEPNAVREYGKGGGGRGGGHDTTTGGWEREPFSAALQGWRRDFLTH